MRDPFGLDSRFHGNNRKGAGMTHPLSSSTESKALRIGDPSPPDIPHLIRDLFRLDSRFHGNDREGAGMIHPLSSSTESKALRIGDPAPPVIPHLMRDLFRLDSRFHGNDTPLVILNRKQSASDWGSIPSRHPALDAGSR